MNDRARIFLICAVLGLATCAGGLWYFQDDFDYVHNGPNVVSAADLVKLDDPARLKSPWVRFTADKLVATDTELVRTDSDRVLARIYLVQVEDRWLIGLLNPNLGGNVIEGQLKTGRPYWPQQIAQVAEESAAIHNGRLLPFEVFGYDDDTQDKAFGYYFLLVCGALGGLSLVGGVYSLFYPPGEASLPVESLDLDKAYPWSASR